jgi:hypothetical protein
MSFKDDLAKFFNDVNEKTAGWQSWLSGNTAGYNNFLQGVNNFNAGVDDAIAIASNEMGKINSVLSTVSDWTTTYMDFVRMDDKAIDSYKAKKAKEKKDKEEAESDPQLEAIKNSESHKVFNNLESSLVQLSNPVKTKLDKFAPEVASGVFKKGNKKEILRSLFTREQDFIGNIYDVFLYIEDQQDGDIKGLCVRTKNLTIPTRQAETFKIDFMNRSIPKIDTSLNLNNTIDLTLTLDDELIIFKELTNHSGITYMPIKATKQNFYDTAEFLQDSAELTSGFSLENSNLVLKICAYHWYARAYKTCYSKDVGSLLDKLNSSTNENLKKLASGYINGDCFTYKNLKIKSLGEINFDKNQAGPMTVSLSALFNPNISKT